MAEGIDLFYQKCDPAEPLNPGDERYVPCDDVRGTDDLVARLANAVRRSDKPMHLLFTGHRGCGKSTELKRLIDRLKKPAGEKRPFFVVYFEVDREDVDVNDVDLADVLLAIVREVGKVMRDYFHEELRPSRLSRFFEDMKSLLGSEVEFNQLTLDAKVAKFTAAIKSSPDARRQIRQALEPNVSNLIQAVNDLLTEAVTKLKAAGYEDLVIIVDNLDRIILRSIPDSQYNTHEQLFINRGAQLTQLQTHVIYTLPISMLYAPTATALTTIYSKQPFTLPMVKVVGIERQINPAGLAAMRDIVQKRLTASSVASDKAFDAPETLDYFCQMSGGHIRNLLIMVRSACDYIADLPLKRGDAEKAVALMRMDFERALNKPEFYNELRKVEETHDLPGGLDDQVLMYNMSILQYINGEDCYVVNPVVRTLHKFLSPPSPPTVPVPDNTP